jgi:hypothetical protein
MADARVVGYALNSPNLDGVVDFYTEVLGLCTARSACKSE